MAARATVVRVRLRVEADFPVAASLADWTSELAGCVAAADVASRSAQASAADPAGTCMAAGAAVIWIGVKVGTVAATTDRAVVGAANSSGAIEGGTLVPAHATVEVVALQVRTSVPAVGRPRRAAPAVGAVGANRAGAAAGATVLGVAREVLAHSAAVGLARWAGTGSGNADLAAGARSATGGTVLSVALQVGAEAAAADFAAGAVAAVAAGTGAADAGLAGGTGVAAGAAVVRIALHVHAGVVAELLARRAATGAGGATGSGWAGRPQAPQLFGSDCRSRQTLP